MVDQLTCPYCGENHPEEASSCPKTGQPLRCSLCGYPLPFQAEECPNCGTAIERAAPVQAPAAVPEPAPATAAPSADWPLCPKCRTPYPPQSKFCPECGKPLGEKKKAAAPAKPRKARQPAAPKPVPAAETQPPAILPAAAQEAAPVPSQVPQAPASQAPVPQVPVAPHRRSAEAEAEQAAQAETARLEQELQAGKARVIEITTSLDRAEKTSRLLAEREALDKKVESASSRIVWGIIFIFVAAFMILLLLAQAFGDSSGGWWVFTLILGGVGLILAFSKPNVTQERERIERELRQLGLPADSDRLAETKARLRREHEELKRASEQNSQKLDELKKKHLLRALAQPAAAPEPAPRVLTIQPAPEAEEKPHPAGRQAVIAALEKQLEELNGKLKETTASLERADKAAGMLTELRELEPGVKSGNNRKGWGWFLVVAAGFLAILLGGNAFDVGDTAGLCWTGLAVLGVIGLALALSKNGARKRQEELQTQLDRLSMPTNPDRLEELRRRLAKLRDESRIDIGEKERQLADLRLAGQKKTLASAAKVEPPAQLHSPAPAAPSAPIPGPAELEREIETLKQRQKDIYRRIDQLDEAAALIAKKAELANQAKAAASRKGWGWFLFGASVVAGFIAAGNTESLGDIIGLCWTGIIVMGLVGLVMGLSSAGSPAESEAIDRKLRQVNAPRDSGELVELKARMRQSAKSLQEEIQEKDQALRALKR